MIQPSVSVKSRGPGVRKIEDALKRAAGIYGTVGVHGDTGTYANGQVTPGQTALWNEFGTKKAPARPFLAPALDDNRSVIARGHKEAMSNVLRGWAPEKALLKFAFMLQLLIQNKIKSNVPPPLSGVYKGQKARGYLGRKYLQRQPARTLIATGLMLRSVRAYIMNEAGERVALSPQTNADAGAPNLSPEGLKNARAQARRDASERKEKNRRARLAKAGKSWLGEPES